MIFVLFASIIATIPTVYIERCFGIFFGSRLKKARFSSRTTAKKILRCCKVGKKPLPQADRALEIKHYCKHCH